MFWEGLYFIIISKSLLKLFLVFTDIVIFYFIRVVATQLSAKLTKHLVLTDPYRIKSPAEAVPVDFSLPLGVQLLYVYLDSKQFSVLRKDAHKCKMMCENIGRNEDKKVRYTKEVSMIK